MPFYNYKKVFQFRKLCFFIRKIKKKKDFQHLQVTSWNISFFIFWSQKVTYGNIRSFLKFLLPTILKLGSSISQNMRNFLGVNLFLFFKLELKGSISKNIRKYKKRFNITARKLHFRKYKEFFRGEFF